MHSRIMELDELPMPKRVPLLGHVYDMQNRALSFLDSLRPLKQPIVPLDLKRFKGVLLTEPHLIEQVLVHSREGYERSRLGTSNVFGNGLLVSEGDYWLQQRRIMQPAFTMEKVASYASNVVDAATTVIDRWKPGTSRDIQIDMSTIALDVVARSCFGLFFNDDQKALISELVNAALMRSIRKLGPSALLQSVPTPANRRFDWMMRTVDEWIYEHIRQRRVSPGEHQDLLTLMLNGGRTSVQLTDRQLRDEIWTVMMTGHETTAISLVWTLMLIAKHPEVEQRLSQEMSAVIGKDVPKFDHLCRMPYLRDVIRESMRLYPTGWMVGRRAVREQHLGGVRIPIDTMVLMSQWFMHRDERWFSDPLTFDPDRWSDGLMQRLPKFVYFPFGGGPHLCIGDQFALMEIAMVLATILPRFKLSMASSQEPVLVPKLTLRPKNGMPMELEERT